MPETDLLGTADAAHLLRRAAFGPIKDEAEKLGNQTRGKAVDKLLGKKTRKKRGPAPKDNGGDELEKISVWWLKQMRSKKWRAQEKLTLFWHDHIPSNYNTVGVVRWMAFQTALFRQYGMGNFRDLMFNITKDAAMLDFLDGFRNQQEAPNENFGREVMELFMLGVKDLAGNDNYTQEDVVQISRCFTGFVRERKGKKNQQTDNIVLDPDRFDDTPKTLFAGMPMEITGNLGVENADGDPFPPNLNVIDVLLTHVDTDGRPTAARFIAKKMWEWYAYPDPSTALIDELADVFVNAGYEVRPLLRAILTHDEFYTDQAKTSTAKNPVDFALQVMNALDIKSKLTELPDMLEDMGMELFNPPGVNGWNNSAAWLATSRYLERLDVAQDMAAGRDKKEFKFIPKKFLDASATDTAAIVDGLLSRLQLTVPAATRQALIDYLDGGSQLSDEDWMETKFRGVFVLLTTLPEFQVH